MIKVVTTDGIKIKEFNDYGTFFASWLLCSNYSIVDFGKDLESLKRDGGIVTVQPIDNTYLKLLHIKEV